MTLAVAVLTLTRDRLNYTKHCFAKLQENAGIDFDHFVLDQGSVDGTMDWLLQYDAELVIDKGSNIGVEAGFNELIDVALETDDYDVVVRIDNDCELTQPDTLRDICQLVLDGGCLLSPRILGLRNPPQTIRELRIGDETILDVPQIGGIFIAAPAWVYDDFRYEVTSPNWGYDDVQICRWWRQQGGTCGYVKRLEAWHYLSTDGQEADDPDYWDRKLRELSERP